MTVTGSQGTAVQPFSGSGDLTWTNTMIFSSALSIGTTTNGGAISYGTISTTKSITPTGTVVPLQMSVTSIADHGTSGDETIGVAYFKNAATTAHQPNHQLATCMVRTSLSKNIWDAYGLQSHLTIADDMATTGDNAHLTAISGKAVLTSGKTASKGWVNAGLFIIEGAGTVTQMCYGVSIVAEVGVTACQGLLHLSSDASVTDAIVVTGAANLTHVFNFSTASGCITSSQLTGGTSQYLKVLINNVEYTIAATCSS